MKRIRSALIIFAFLFFGFGASILNFFVFPLIHIFIKDEKNRKYKYSDIIHSTWNIFIKFLELLTLIKVNTNDIEKLKNIKNKVIVSTHPSFVDIVILIALIPHSSCFVKKELATNPIINRLVTSIFITNDVDLEGLKTKSKEVLDLGFNLIIFPSGIRHHKDEYPKIKKGASLVALNASKDIIPIKLFADGDFLFINKPFYDGDEKTVNFEVEVCEKINLSDFITESEIITKKNITKQITNELYS